MLTKGGAGYGIDTYRRKTQAIDILAKLQSDSYSDASRVGYEKLRNAKFYLDDLLKQQFDVPKEEK